MVELILVEGELLAIVTRLFRPVLFRPFSFAPRPFRPLFFRPRRILSTLTARLF